MRETPAKPTERPCTKCSIIKPLSEYYKDKRSADGHRRDCRECNVLRTGVARDRRKAEGRFVQYPASSVLTNATSKRYYTRNRIRVLEHSRRKWFENNYNITFEDRALMMNAQDNKCLLCDEILIDPHVDHCHESGVIRGVLCPSCNKGLGFFRDNPAALDRAAAYLRKYE